MNYLGLGLWIIGLIALVYWGQTFDRKHYDFLAKRKLFFGLSAIFLAISIFTLATQGLKKGLDFTGGTIFELGAYKQVTPTQVEDTLKDFPGLGEVHVQVGTDMIDDPTPDEGKPNQYQKVIIRLTLADGSHLDPIKTKEALEHIKGKLGDIKELRTASIGPTISGELTANALKALAFALIAQLIYIFFRFGNQVRYGLAADLALLHDLTIMAGFYSLAGKEVDSPFVAAVLTVVGYSVMDSVVIFDRIRENLNEWWGEHGEDKEAPFEHIVNVSLGQTMSRSINTVVTVLITLIAIHYFGGETLQNFSFALLVGIVGGGYSSVGLASPIVAAINKKYPVQPPDRSNWYDTDEVVPEHHMGEDDDIGPDPGEMLPRSAGRRRSRGKRS
jgi:preprotein translocase subunit SecF